MDQLEHPSNEVWEKRRRWVESIAEKEQGEGIYLVSEQACTLTSDVQATFCAGAWAGTIILSMAVIDAALRETELPGFRGNTKKLLEAVNGNPRLQSLRKCRNELVHVGPEKPALTVDQQWTERNNLEIEAKEAIELMFEALFINPGV